MGMRVRLLLATARGNRRAHLALGPGTVGGGGLWGGAGISGLAARNWTRVETALAKRHGPNRGDPVVQGARRGGGDCGTNTLTTGTPNYSSNSVLVHLSFLRYMALLHLELLLVLMLMLRQHLQLGLVLLVLNPSAHALLRLGHRRNRRELLHHRVVPEGALDREGGVSCLDTAVLALQQFDLLVQQILRQLIRILNAGPLEHFAVTPDRALLVQRRRGHGRLVVATANKLVVTVGLVMVVVRQLLRRHIVLLLLLGRRRLRQVHVTSSCGTVVCGRTEATAGITAGAGTTGQDTTTTTGMMMVCRVNLGWTIDLLWKI